MDPVRALTPADSRAYVALRREMLADAPWAFGADPDRDRGSDGPGIARSLAGPEYAILGAFEEGRLIAAAGVFREENVKRRHVAIVWGVYVTPGCRGRGLGRAVVAGAIDAARAWDGVEVAQLSVSERATAAHRLYESLGFATWGVEPRCLRVGGQAFDERHMWLSLDRPVDCR